MSVALHLSRGRKAGDLLNVLLFAGLITCSELPFSLLEVGARGGLQSRWTRLHTLAWLRSIFVEADATEAKEIEKRYGTSAVLPVTAGDTVRQATLYLTRSPDQTSILRPDQKVHHEKH